MSVAPAVSSEVCVWKEEFRKTKEWQEGGWKEKEKSNSDWQIGCGGVGGGGVGVLQFSELQCLIVIHWMVDLIWCEAEN